MKKITVLVLIILATLSMPLMASDGIATAIPVAVSADVAPLVDAVKSQTTTIGVGFTFLIATMLGLAFRITHPDSLSGFLPNTRAPAKQGRSAAKTPEAKPAISGVQKKPRKPAIKNRSAASVT
jgi:hypothetical protein